MYQKVKLTKRQIKEDKFTAFMLNARSWFIDNWQISVIGVAAVVLLVVAGVYYAQSQEARANEAAGRFARAMMDYRNGSNQVALMGLQQIVDEFSTESAAEQATFLLGKINLEARNYEEARRNFELYLSKYKKDALTRAAALAGIAACLEEQGAYADAAAQYQKAYDEYPDGPLSGDYLGSVLRNQLQAGSFDQAATTLDTIKEKFEGSELVNRSIRSFAQYQPGK